MTSSAEKWRRLQEFLNSGDEDDDREWSWGVQLMNLETRTKHLNEFAKHRITVLLKRQLELVTERVEVMLEILEKEE